MNIEMLQQRYRAPLLARIDDLATLIENADRIELLRRFHSISGIAGTIGYAETTAIAREAEQRCEEDGDRSQLRLLVARLRSALGDPSPSSARLKER